MTGTFLPRSAKAAWNGRFQALDIGCATASTDGGRPVNADHRETSQTTAAGEAVATASYGAGPI
jgi:hypothetical protein